MFTLICTACALVGVTVMIQAVGFAVVLRMLMRMHGAAQTAVWPIIRTVVILMLVLTLIHFVEICVWGLFYFWQGCFPDFESAFYFSGVTYTTTGYGDVVLPKPWRILAPLEAQTGILMFGLSTGLFFAVVFRLISNRTNHQALISDSPLAKDP